VAYGEETPDAEALGAVAGGMAVAFYEGMSVSDAWKAVIEELPVTICEITPAPEAWEAKDDLPADAVACGKRAVVN
jgi:hypothetical protein